MRMYDVIIRVYVVHDDAKVYTLLNSWIEPYAKFTTYSVISICSAY